MLGYGLGLAVEEACREVLGPVAERFVFLTEQ